MLGLELELKESVLDNDYIIKIKDSDDIYINDKRLLEILDKEFENIKIKKTHIKILFTINKNNKHIGNIEYLILPTDIREDSIYNEWCDIEYSSGIIAKSIIEENKYYKVKNKARISILSQYILFNEKHRGRGYGKISYRLSEKILQRFFKVEAIYLISAPLDMSIEESIYYNYMYNEEENDYIDIDNDIGNIVDIKINKLDGIYKSIGMKVLSRKYNTYYKNI